MVRQDAANLCMDCSDDLMRSKGSSRGVSRSTAQAGSRYVEGYEPESEYGVAKRSQRGMIEELSLRLSEPRQQTGALSSGESMMVDTMRKSRSRPHDRDRVDELAIPCRQASTCASWRCPPPDPLAPPPGSAEFTSTLPEKANRLVIKPPGIGAQRLDDLLSRLAAPRQRPPVGGNIATGEKIVMESQVALKSKTTDVCMRTLTARLSNPRVPDPSVPPPSGESAMLDVHNRKPKRAANLGYLSRLARPNKRGGSAHAWRAMTAPAGTEGSGEQALRDDRTATPLSMRTTSPPQLHDPQDSEHRGSRGSLKLKGVEDINESSGSLKLSGSGRSAKEKSSPKGPAPQIFVGNA